MATILYLNAITTALPISITLAFGGLLLVLLPDWSHLQWPIALFVACVLSINVIFLNQNIRKFLIKIVLRVTKRNLSFDRMSSWRIVTMQFIYLIGAFLWALAGCLIAMSMGFQMDGLNIISVSASMLLGDVIGLLVLIAPGGLGVREGTMYLILKGTGVISFALVFPMIIRLLSIVTDVIAGIASLLIIGKSKFPRQMKGG
jgi:hypothetical protein